MPPRVEYIEYTGDGLLNACDTNLVQGSITGSIKALVNKGIFIRLINSAGSSSRVKMPFVLFSATQRADDITPALIKLLVKHKVSSGFSSTDAVNYDPVYVIGALEPAIQQVLEACEVEFKVVDDATSRKRLNKLTSLLEGKGNV